jgi:hypothetical protein
MKIVCKICELRKENNYGDLLRQVFDLAGAGNKKSEPGKGLAFFVFIKLFAT